MLKRAIWADVKFLLLSLLAGLLSACGFEPLGLWPLMIVTLSALLWLVARAPSLRSAFARGYWFGVGQFLLGLNWIVTAFTFQSNMPAWLGYVAVLLLSFYLAIYPAMAAGLAWRWGLSSRAQAGIRSVARKSGSRLPLGHIRYVLVFAAAWTVGEWLRATLFTGFAWNPIGVVLLPTDVAYLSMIIGTYGLSGVAILLAGVILLLLNRRTRSSLILAAVVGAAVVIVQLTAPSPLPAPNIPVRIVQPNISQQNKWRPGFEEENFARLAALTSMHTDRSRLLLWPEAAITEPLGDSRPQAAAEVEALRRRVGSLLGPGDLLLTGGISVGSPDGARVSTATNSVFAMDSSGRIHARVDKAHLVPFGEYLPMRRLMSAIGFSRLVPGNLDYIPGPGPRTVDFGSFGRIGFLICYEIIFSGEVVAEGKRPTFIFNPSNDAWFGPWGPPQHLAQARLRALEEGLPVLRSTPTGISAVIDADGNLLGNVPWRTAGAIDSVLPFPKPPTWFARAGNIMPFLFAFLLVAVALAVRREHP